MDSLAGHTKVMGCSVMASQLALNEKNEGSTPSTPANLALTEQKPHGSLDRGMNATHRDYNASLNILKQGLCGLGTKSHDKQKRGEALRIVSGKTERVIKSVNHETKKLESGVGNPPALAGG